MKQFKAEIISIGNEVLAGYTINSNAVFISQQLSAVGLPVMWVTTIADEHDEIIAALTTANRRADAVLVTGGLGPTPDDITKQSICDYFNRKMVSDEKALTDVESFLNKRGRTMTEANRLQAMIPKSDHVIYNGAGTAPGLVLNKENSVFFFMPGVPEEMKAMVTSFILKHLSENFDLPPMHTRLLRSTGIAESTLHERVETFLDKYPQFPVAFLPRQIGVDLRFRYIAGDKDDLEIFDKFVNEVHTQIKKHVFTTKEKEMEEVLGALLRSNKLSLSTAESFTGGLINNLLTNIPGSSEYFLGGYTTYSNESKIKLLNVKAEVLQKHGAVSEETVLEMIHGIKKIFNSDCAIATTGIAGPGGGTDKKPVGLSYVAAIYKNAVFVKRFLFGGNRIINKRRGAMAGMEMLRRLILGIK